MKIKKNMLQAGLLLTLSIVPVSCVDLDIPPMNIVTDDDIMTSANGIEAYMARLYSMLPIEDFRYNKDGLTTNAFYAQPSCLTGEAVGRDTFSANDLESFGYWDHAYTLIREANYLIETLPQYASYHSELDIQHWIAEAHFVRAFAYFALVKRYGGVPKVDKVMDPSNPNSEIFQLYRASEEEIWNFISDDLQKAINELPTESEKKGRANKYVAAAFKSRAMLFAGSIAKYNTVNETYEGTRICGISAERAVDYFKQAYEASKIVDEGNYALYKGEWSATNKEAQYNNYVNIFLKDTPENIFIRYFDYPDFTHSYDSYAQPIATSTGGSNTEICPTLDFVEMFDGFDKDEEGCFENLDEQGHYKLYSTTMEPFENCEPRLRATVILPGDMFKDQKIEIWRGIYTGETEGGINPLLPPGTYGFYDYMPEFSDPATSVLKLAKNETENADPAFLVTLGDGTKMRRSGPNGTVCATLVGCSITGFLVRKYLDPTLTNTAWYQSSTDWIELRYAEVLLNRAEAAVELLDEGNTEIEGLQDEAYRCINMIRERAGADMLQSASDVDIDVVRKERRKELAFEGKIYWDLRRWRILDDEQTNRTYRTLQPFMAAKENKYFMDIKYMEQGFVYTYDTRYYYMPIPYAEIQKDPNIKQNPGF